MGIRANWKSFWRGRRTVLPIFPVLEYCLYKPKDSKFAFKTALLSNINAVRHYKDYLLDIQDIVWTLDRTGDAKKVGDLPLNQDIYNLFDGIITFTPSHVRDE